MNTQKVVLVTGASSGIGQATAIEFAKLNYKVAITGRDTQRLAIALECLIRESPMKCPNNFLVIEAEFEDMEQVDLIISKTIDKFKCLDVLINNAGNPGRKRDLSHSDWFDDFKQILQVNLVAPVRLSQLATPYILRNNGVIVNVSSIADRLGMPNISYSVSKAGLNMLSKALANAYDGSNVRVLTVAPGPIATNFTRGIEKYGPMTCLHRVGQAREVADTIVFLCSPKASFIHGCTIDVDGGCYVKFGGIKVAIGDYELFNNINQTNKLNNETVPIPSEEAEQKSSKTPSQQPPTTTLASKEKSTKEVAQDLRRKP